MTAFGLFLIGLIALEAKFQSVLYLLIFLAAYKCFSLHEPQDHLHAIVIVFFIYLACAIITSSVAYVLFLLGFIVLIIQAR